MTFTRPYRLERAPANQAPMAAPTSADETANPVRPAPREKSSDRASTAPLITEVSKPNRNPPTAAAMLIPTTLGLSFWSVPGEEAPDESAGVWEEDMVSCLQTARKSVASQATSASARLCYRAFDACSELLRTALAPVISVRAGPPRSTRHCESRMTSGACPRAGRTSHGN